MRRRRLLLLATKPTGTFGLIKTRVFVATMTAVVACVVILWATFFNPALLGLATAMVPLLTALCTGLLTTEYLERRAQTNQTKENNG